MQTEEAFFVTSSTGCTCCRSWNRTYGPLRTQEEADDLAKRNRDNKTHASQYASNGRHTVHKGEIEELPDGRMIINDKVHTGSWGWNELGHPDDYYFGTSLATYK